MQVDINVTGEKRIKGQFKKFIKNDALIKGLLTSEPDQIETWVDNNINNLSDAKDLFKKILLMLRFISRKSII